ncbi:hypothetical protein [Clostridioides sp. ES-S-0010-02]|uniref:hypothetical protein n=1 Tax=Clostridioides sp. ES-S-0010-02 TaxID=2770776 RepID=UPI001D1070A0|nr:hypothetical protein JJC01_03875 [Clostridioides sp. ES-S-0010-02]
MDSKGFKQVTNSLSLYHRITKEKLNDDIKYKNISIDKLYVDLLPNNEILESILEKKTTFLVGRRGTGKSTIFARAQYQIHKDKNDLSVYLNAKTLFKEAEVNLLDIGGNELALNYDERLRITLVKNIIKHLVKSMTEELKNENYNFFEKFKNKFRDSNLQKLIDELENMLSSNTLENINKIFIDNQSTTNTSLDSASLSTSLKTLDLTTSLKSESTTQNQTQNTNILALVFKVGDIIKKFLEILSICNRKSLYIFIDDYSELDVKERTLFMDTIILPMYDIGVDKIHFKISCYPNKLHPIKLESSKFIINQIDLFEVYGSDHNIANIQQKAINYTKNLLTNSINNFCDNEIDKYFDTKTTSMDEYFRYLYNVSQNVPRVLGLILRNCYSLSIAYDKPITLSTINQASKKYYNDHIKINFNKQSGVKYSNTDDKIDIFVQESLVQELTLMAQKNKYELPSSKPDSQYFEGIKEAPTSHFTLPTDMNIYMEDLEFNGFIHKINKIAAKGREREKYKNSSNYLYALDYGLCLEEKILYGRPQNGDSKYYQQRWFVYSDVILSVLNNNKRIVCKNCNHTFPIENLELFQKFKMKCMECLNGICEIEFDPKLISKASLENDTAIWTNQEFEIIKALYILTDEYQESITVNQISGEIDYNYQLITSLCKSLSTGGFINVNKSFNPYTYKLTGRAMDIYDNLYANSEVDICYT